MGFPPASRSAPALTAVDASPAVASTPEMCPGHSLVLVAPRVSPDILCRLRRPDALSEVLHIQGWGCARCLCTAADVTPPVGAGGLCPRLGSAISVSVSRVSAGRGCPFPWRPLGLAQALGCAVGLCARGALPAASEARAAGGPGHANPVSSPTLPPAGLRLPALLEGAALLRRRWRAHGLRLRAQVRRHVEKVSPGAGVVVRPCLCLHWPALLRPGQ